MGERTIARRRITFAGHDEPGVTGKRMWGVQKTFRALIFLRFCVNPIPIHVSATDSIRWFGLEI